MAKITRRNLMLAFAGCSVNLLTTDSVKATESESDPWKSFYGNQRNTGARTSIPGLEGEPRMSWSFEVDSGKVNSPVSDGEHIFFTTHEGELYCTDLETGERRWARTIGEWCEITPVVHDGFIIVGSMHGNLTCIDTDTGSIHWSKQHEYAFRPAPVAADGTVFLCHLSNRIIAVDIETGETLWEHDDGRENHDRGYSANPVFLDQNMYAAGEDGVISQFDVETGEKGWEITLDVTPLSLLALDDVLVVGTTGPSSVVFLDVHTGEQTAMHEIESAVRSTPVTDGEVLYIAGALGDLTAIDIENQRERWQVNVGSRQTHSLLLVQDTIYTTGSYNEIHAFDTDDGTQQWSKHLGEDGYLSSPVPVGESVFVGSDAKLFALEEGGGGLPIPGFGGVTALAGLFAGVKLLANRESDGN